MTLRKIDLMHKMFGEIPDKKCMDCSNLIYHRMSHKWYKCTVYGDTSSVASDWKISNTACGMFNKEYDGNPAIHLVQAEKKREMQIEGQISLFE